VRSTPVVAFTINAEKAGYYLPLHSPFLTDVMGNVAPFTPPLAALDPNSLGFANVTMYFTH